MPKKIFKRPNDKSLEVYKDFIKGITKALNPDNKSTMTEEEWIAAWKKFWSKADSKTDTSNDQP